MWSNDDLLAEFSRYKHDNIITAAEFSRLAPYLLDATAAPDWILRLQKACALASSGDISQDDLKSIKNEIFSTVPKHSESNPSAMTTVAAGDDVSANTASAAVRASGCANIVRICTGIACLIGLLPLPVADAPFLIILQYVMLKKICAKYNREPGAALVLIVVSALLGPIIFNAFVKRIPVTGSIVGACVAGGFTWFIGRKVLVMLEKGWQFNLKNFLRAIWGAK